MEQLVDPFFLRQLRDGKCVLFAGAGLSAAAGFPTWENLLGEISSELSVRQSLHEEGVIWLNIFSCLMGT